MIIWFSDGEMPEDELAASVEEGLMVDVDEFDKVVGEALDDVEVVEETEEDVVKEVERPIVKLVNGILIDHREGGGCSGWQVQREDREICVALTQGVSRFRPPPQTKGQCQILHPILRDHSSLRE